MENVDIFGINYGKFADIDETKQIKLKNDENTINFVNGVIKQQIKYEENLYKEVKSYINAMEILMIERDKLLNALSAIIKIRNDLNGYIYNYINEARNSFLEYRSTVVDVEKVNNDTIFSGPDSGKAIKWNEKMNSISLLFNEGTYSTQTYNKRNQKEDGRYDFEEDSTDLKTFRGIGDLTGLINRYLETSIVVRLNKNLNELKKYSDEYVNKVQEYSTKSDLTTI